MRLAEYSASLIVGEAPWGYKGGLCGLEPRSHEVVSGGGGGIL